MHIIMVSITGLRAICRRCGFYADAVLYPQVGVYIFLNVEYFEVPHVMVTMLRMEVIIMGWDFTSNVFKWQGISATAQVYLKDFEINRH